VFVGLWQLERTREVGVCFVGWVGLGGGERGRHMGCCWCGGFVWVVAPWGVLVVKSRGGGGGCFVGVLWGGGVVVRGRNTATVGGVVDGGGGGWCGCGCVVVQERGCGFVGCGGGVLCVGEGVTVVCWWGC